MSSGVWVCSVQCDRHLGLPSLWIVPCGCETRWKRSWLCLQELLHFWGVSCCRISETSGISRQAPIRMKDSRLVCTLGIRVVLLTSCPSILANWQFNHPQIFKCVISCRVRIFPCRSTTPLHMHMHSKEGCGSDPHMFQTHTCFRPTHVNLYVEHTTIKARVYNKRYRNLTCQQFLQSCYCIFIKSDQ